MGNQVNCCEKNTEVPDNANQGDFVDSGKRPRERNKLQNGGGANGILNTDGKKR